MALRVLTNDERLILNNSSEFREKVKQAVRDAGDYWANHDQTGYTDTLANKIAWAKNRMIGIQIVQNDAYVSQGEIAVKAVKASKGMQFDLGAAPLTEQQLLVGIIPAKYEEIAALLMTIFGEDINMTLGGN